MNLKTVKERATQLEGKTAWGTRLGFGSFITVEFGLETRTLGGHVHGEWHLWVYCCAWHIEQKRQLVAASEDERSYLQKRVPILNGRRVTSVEIGEHMSDAAFNFEGSVTLRTLGVYSRGREHWMLYTPGGKVLTIGPGSSASFTKASANERGLKSQGRLQQA